MVFIRAKYLEILNKSFIIAPFDARAALKYAEIMHNRFDEIKTLQNSTGTQRQKMKVDHMIVATAIVNGANCIYSTDGGLIAFAKGYIDVKDLPPINEQSIVNSLIQQELSFGSQESHEKK